MSLSSPLVSVTGDQSFGEAISAKKIICYEIRFHKKALNDSFYAALTEEALKHSDPTNLLKVLALLEFKLEGHNLTEALSLLSNDALLAQISALYNPVFEKKDLAKNLILHGFGIDLSDPDVVMRLREGKVIGLPDDFDSWNKQEKILFHKVTSLQSFEIDDRCLNDIKRDIETIISIQYPCQSFYEELSKILKNDDFSFYLKQKQWMSHFERGNDQDAYNILLKEKDALLNVIKDNNFAFFFKNKPAMPNVASEMFLLKFQLCLQQIGNGPALEQEG